MTLVIYHINGMSDRAYLYLDIDPLADPGERTRPKFPTKILLASFPFHLKNIWYDQNILKFNK